MPILTQDGRVAIALSVSNEIIHLAWGIGDGAWTSTVPAESALSTSLIGEIGRREVSEVAFVVENPAGDIIVPGGVFSISPTPTNKLYVRTQFDFADASSSVIREAGIFVGSTMVGGLPIGQKYFVPAEVATPGRMLHVEHFEPIFRSPSIRESFETVLVF